MSSSCSCDGLISTIRRLQSLSTSTPKLVRESDEDQAPEASKLVRLSISSNHRFLDRRTRTRPTNVGRKVSRANARRWHWRVAEPLTGSASKNVDPGEGVRCAPDRTHVALFVGKHSSELPSISLETAPHTHKGGTATGEQTLSQKSSAEGSGPSVCVCDTKSARTKATAN